MIRLPQHRSSRIRGEANACPRYVDSSGGALVRAADSASGPLISVIGDEGPEVRAELSIERIKLDGWQSNCDTLLLIDNVKDILLDRVFVQRSKGHGVWVKRNHQVLARYVECHQCRGIGFWGQLGGDNSANWIKAAGCGLGIKLGAGWTVPGE